MARAKTGTGAGRRMTRVAELLTEHVRAVVGVLLLITAGLSYPLLFWTPDETASLSPVTEVTRTQELIGERFADDVFDFLLLVEATDGDILEKKALLALFENSAALREDEAVAEYLVEFRHPDLAVDVNGIWTIADAVDRLLRGLGSSSGLAGADQEQVDAAVGAILETSTPIDWGLAAQTSQDDEGVWHSPALFASVATDNEKLGGGGFLVTIGTDSLDKEYLARDLADLITGSGEALRAWAPAGDVNLTSQEQGELAGPFIGLTIAAVLLIVGFSFRSYWAVAVSGAALAMLMVWLRGGANLAGFKSDQVISIILPISIISFGIDSAFHSIGRMREHRQSGAGPRRAFTLAISSVIAALALAATSDMAAFLSNTASGIESLIQFGFGAAGATVAAFVLLGGATSLLMSAIAERTDERFITRFGAGGDAVLSLLAAALATVTVLVLVFISPEIGLALLVGYLLLALVVPYRLARRQRDTSAPKTTAGSGSPRIGTVVSRVAARPWLTTLVAAVITGLSVWAGLHLEVTFDVANFFSPNSDFVVGLDKTAEYLGDQGGEPAQVYIETDLTDPSALTAIRGFIEDVQTVSDNPLAVDTSGAVRVNPGVLQLVDLVPDPTAVDSREDLAALYDEALARGVGPVGNLQYTPNDIGTILWKSDDGERFATVLSYEIPDTRTQENVKRTRDVLEPAAEALEATLAVADPEANVIVAGSAIYRDDQLVGIRRALLLALPIAVIACFVISAAFMRSLRYALVSTIPILLVVTWLYGIMYVAGYSINVVTAIIGAVSVGIGIDFSTHFTMRFLQERQRLGKIPALAAAGAGTGGALFGSALTSVAGFGILAFAPMPLFSSYGLLTAVMIVLALAASLLVLPALLALVTRGGKTDSAPEGVIDLRDGGAPIRFGLARDVSEAVLDRLLAAFANEVREGDVRIDTHPGATVPGLVADGTVDIGLVVHWPGTVEADQEDLEVLPLIREEVVVVGNAERPTLDTMPIADLGHSLLVAGPHAESADGALRLLRTEVSYPALAHTVPDVITGIRIVAITGGGMLLPRSMAPPEGYLPVRSLHPPQWLETRLLVSSAHADDPGVFDLVVRLSRSIDEDERIHLDEAVQLDQG